jgi:diguanylate cyclase (GGDEF)-like protein
MVQGESQSVLVVAEASGFRNRIQRALKNGGYTVYLAAANQAIESVFAHPPHCLFLGEGLDSRSEPGLITQIKSDNVYGHLPVIVMVTAEEVAAGIDWGQLEVDDYLMAPFTDAELVSRVKLCLSRSNRDVNANPLTGLPGNITIMREAERRIARGKPFAFAYLDIDNFKPYNDCYGFNRGDEVLRMAARILVNSIRTLGSPDTYVGHIGGDDFVFIAPCELASQACESIVRDFNLIVPSFYDEEDRSRGHIQSFDRQGNSKTFPLMSVSIAVVDTAGSHVRHIADLSARIAHVKSYTKKMAGSNYMVDRRR